MRSSFEFVDIVERMYGREGNGSLCPDAFLRGIGKQDVDKVND